MEKTSVPKRHQVTLDEQLHELRPQSYIESFNDIQVIATELKAENSSGIGGKVKVSPNGRYEFDMYMRLVLSKKQAAATCAIILTWVAANSPTLYPYVQAIMKALHGVT